MRSVVFRNYPPGNRIAKGHSILDVSHQRIVVADSKGKEIVFDISKGDSIWMNGQLNAQKAKELKVYRWSIPAESYGPLENLLYRTKDISFTYREKIA
jgi:lysyl-tRNA synthetase class II